MLYYGGDQAREFEANGRVVRIRRWGYASRLLTVQGNGPEQVAVSCSFEEDEEAARRGWDSSAKLLVWEGVSVYLDHCDVRATTNSSSVYWMDDQRGGGVADFTGSGFFASEAQARDFRAALLQAHADAWWALDAALPDESGFAKLLVSQDRDYALVEAAAFGQSGYAPFAALPNGRISWALDNSSDYLPTGFRHGQEGGCFALKQSWSPARWLNWRAVEQPCDGDEVRVRPSRR